MKDRRGAQGVDTVRNPTTSSLPFARPRSAGTNLHLACRPRESDMPFRLYDPSSPGLSLMDYVLGAVCGMWRVADGGRCAVATALTV